ncbi:M48 family metallopeptidase [Methylomarinum vadi]|uniref:M48 family metallopeptidase n=1 Tax=Methylomarinum vadi TaxID=438855 RepID=UPI0004DF9DB6|nr:SprT family zinc-dependent metalloprotease [Methylomarinum vadi]
MVSRIELGDIVVDVVFKDIKNIHLGVYPPDGKVRISAPERMKLDMIRVFAISKLPWIKQQRRKLIEQERETPREYLNRESHYLWGRRYLLRIDYTDDFLGVFLRHSKIVVRVRPGSDRENIRSVLEDWYRETLKEAVKSLLDKWEPILGIKVERFFVQRMKTKWGSCNPAGKSVRLNTELVKKPQDCLEYIVVHEMLHLLEPTHNDRFIGLMDHFMPDWRHRRDELNRLPVRHERWDY